MGLIVSLVSFGFVFGWLLVFLVLLFTHMGTMIHTHGGEGGLCGGRGDFRHTWRDEQGSSRRQGVGEVDHTHRGHGV